MSEGSNQNWFRHLAEQLTMETVIIIVAGGVLTFLILFIFAKRQIMRFAIRSHRGPHAPIGVEANKTMRREIIRRIDAIPKITFEPKMLREEETDENTKDAKPKPCHYYRMKAVDDAKNLEQSMLMKKLGKRNSFESLRSHLIGILALQIDQRIVHQYCDFYEAARFDPKPFKEDDYKAFNALHKQLQQAVAVCQPKTSSRSPIKTLNTPAAKAPRLSKPFGDSDNSDDENYDCSTETRGKLELFAVPYLRRLTKVDKSRWTQPGGIGNPEEERALQDINTRHISIVSSSKEESTAV